MTCWFKHSITIEDAVDLVTSNISLIRQAENKDQAINHCEIAKVTKKKVAITSANQPMLAQLAAAYREHAEVMESWGCHQMALKSWKRADEILPPHQEPGAIFKSIARAGSPASLMVPMATVCLSTAISSTSILGPSVHTESSANQRTTPLPSSGISCITGIAVPVPAVFFDKDICPPSIEDCPFPRPNCHLRDTRQLAVCLALLQVKKLPEDNLSQEACAWLNAARANTDEKNRLEALATSVVHTFVRYEPKGSEVIAEVVPLAFILNSTDYRLLLKSFVEAVERSTLLDLHSLDGLAQLIQRAAPGSINSGDLVDILRVLHKRLQATHSESVSHRYQLLLAVSRVLDAMVDANIGDVDRINLHEPLTDLLRVSESSKDPYLSFEAAYATQALLNVSDDESIWHAGFRRVWLVLTVGAAFAKVPDPTEIKGALEGLEKLYEAGKRATNTLKDALKAIKTGETAEFTVEEGLKFKSAWYRALRTAELCIQTGKLVYFKDLVTTTRCRQHPMFQMGICRLLGQFAADARWGLEARQSAVAFIEGLYRTDNIWDRQKDVDQVIFDVLTNVVSNHGTDFEAAQVLLEVMRKQNTALTQTVNLHSHPSNKIQPRDPACHTPPEGILLKAVQRGPDMEDIQSALKTYYARNLSILRVSGESLPLETCFVNLAIVEAPAQREKDKQDLKEQAAVFHRIPSSEAVVHVNMQKPIPLEQLFDKRKLRDGKEDIPKTILVQGRAGVGKTTLCKKLVHVHQTGQWKDRFDAVLWLPLRQIKAYRSRTLEGLFREKFFTQGLDQDGLALAHELAISAQQGRVLFILDGLDEIAKDARGEEGIALKEFVGILLLQQHVVITSRPSGLDRSLLPPSIDLELETIGFNQQNVNDFVSRVLSPKPAETVQRFIQQTPLIRGLVNIPVQLDVICYSWDSLPTEGPAITMTGLYQLMVRKLWCKDAVRLRKSADGEILTHEQISQMDFQEIDDLMATEMQHLGYLAFKGLTNDHQIEFDEKAILNACRDLKKYCVSQTAAPQLLDRMKQTSFLHTADADLDPNKSNSQQAWYFLHLTFQEYFAATWVAQHLQQPFSAGVQEYFASTRSTNDLQQPLPMGMMTVEHAKAFVQEHKYNPRFEIMWWMVAGILEGKALEDFFNLLQGAPRDLIGGRHQQILASCLNEARARLNSTVLTRLDAELMKWLHFEIQTYLGKDTRSMLGSQSSFPESLLVTDLDLRSSSKAVLVNTLGARSTLSESAIQSLIGALKDEDADVRKSAASALGNQSTLSESAIQSLIGALNHENTYVRWIAASALRSQSRLSEAAMQSLIDAINHENADVRSLAAEGLGNQSRLPEAAIQPLIGAVNHENADVRWIAASALGKHSTLPEAAMQSLIGALKDENEDVRWRAAEALGNQSTLSEAAIQSLIGALKDENADVRWIAASALGKQSTLSEAAMQSLIGAPEDENADVRWIAVSALVKQSRLSEAAIQSLIGALKDENADVRWIAASALGKQSTLSEAAIQSLTGALKDENANVRSSAASALGKHSILSEAAIRSLVGALRDENEDVRWRAAEALGNQFRLSEAAIQSLIGALKDENADVRWIAAEAIGNQSRLSEAAIQSLIGALKDGNANVRSSAASALGKHSILSEVAIRPLTGALKDENADVRWIAASALGKQSTLSEAAIQSLIGALKDENANVRSSAASALGNQSTLSEAAIQSLIGALKDENADVRKRASSALGNQSTLSESAIQSLIGALKDDNANVRSLAAGALGRQSTLSEAAIQSLIGALKDDNADVRSLAAWALGRQSTLSEAAIQSLIGALKDENADVRSLATSVLGKQSTLSEAAIQSLIGALKDDNANVRPLAAGALGKQSTLSEAAIQSLIGALKDDNANVRSLASSALGNQSTLSKAAIQSLMGALKDDNANARSLAASALGNQFRLSGAAIQSLIGALKDENDDVRRRAASALGNQFRSSEAVIQSLIGVLQDENDDVRSSAASALGNRFRLSEAAVQSLIGALKDDNANVRSLVAGALGRQSTLSEAAIQSLIGALKDDNADVRSLAAWALGRQSTLSEAAIQSLIGALKDENADVRSLATSVLGKQSTLSEAAIQSLTGALSHENASVRGYVTDIFTSHCYSLCMALAGLSETEIALVYKNHLFSYSCRRVMSLQVQDSRLCYYTEQGLVHTEHMEVDKAVLITSAFEAVQREAGIQ
ncbi:unnamed protein product [Mortierella alpina]